jgi:hypothetical protein
MSTNINSNLVVDPFRMKIVLIHMRTNQIYLALPYCLPYYLPTYINLFTSTSYFI